MKATITALIRNALERAKERGTLKLINTPEIPIEVPEERFGDLSTTIALTLAPIEKRPPKEIADIIIKGLERESQGIGIEKIEIAGAGFINFTFSKGYWYEMLRDVLRDGDDFGRIDIGKGQRVLIEFVSANPTGPLHIGHGRGAAIGDALSNLLIITNFKVHREYYINDVGTQMDKVGLSTYIRYQQILSENGLLDERTAEAFEKRDIPYLGSYVIDIARRIYEEKGAMYKYGDIPEEESIPFFTSYASRLILEGIKEDLRVFGVTFDTWLSEKGMHEDGKVDKSISELKDKCYIFEKDGALWLRSTDFGDDKDRVVVRNSGEKTYLASDIAYHKYKFDRGFERMIDIWGSDHHGYVPRMKAAVQALGHDPQSLKVLLVQLVTLLREGKPAAISTRAGEFVTLREVIDEVGRDAARYIFLTRRPDSHLEFDLEVLKRQSAENPIYYVQYAYARVSSLFREAEMRGILLDLDKIDLHLLTLPEELNLMKALGNYLETVEGSAITLEPHRITYYLHDLASKLHSYYYKYRIITEDIPLTYARLSLMKAVGIVIRNALRILGVSAPERM